MSTTTPDDGAADAAQPQESAAVSTGHNDDQVITTDGNGTPTMTPVASDVQDEAVSGEPTEEASQEEAPAEPAETQAADKTDAEIAAWSEKKGITINPENPNEVKLARMQLEAERKMHEARQVQSPVQPPEELPLTGEDPNYDTIAERLNRQEQLSYVRNWFDANPDAKDHRTELQQIAATRPWLSNMDDVYAHFLANPSREAELRKAGGKEALTNLAQKQQQIPPSAGATNSSVYQSAQITPNNVYELVDKNDQSWFEKNHKAISDAMAGKMPS